MDTYTRIRGAPLRSRSSVRKETVHDCSVQCVKSLLRNKKELCSVDLELPPRESRSLTEIHYVCLPRLCEEDDISHQALLSLPGGLYEILRSVHIQNLKNDEVLLLKDARTLALLKDAGSLCWLKTVCVLRHNPSSSFSVGALMDLLGCYIAGVRYALELQTLQTCTTVPNQTEEDDTNQSVSSIEDDFVTALEHLEEEDTGGKPLSSSYHLCKKRDVALQTVPAHSRRKESPASCIIMSSTSEKVSTKRSSCHDVSVPVQKSSVLESQWTPFKPRGCVPSPLTHVSESEESECSSPSPIIFLDEVGYQKSLLAKLDIPQLPGEPREQVEDSDSEVSEFFDSFDQFDDLGELCSERSTLTLPLDITSIPATQKKTPQSCTSGLVSKNVPRTCSTKGMNPQRFDQSSLPANVKKPTPLKPDSAYTFLTEGSDSSWPVQCPSEDNGGLLFSPVTFSAFSPLVDCSTTMEYFWKTDGEDSPGLHKPNNLCSLFKRYSDFASSLSKEILESVCGYKSAVDISENKNLSCVCHKEFRNTSGYMMKLSEIQETVTVAKIQKKLPCLKDGIQRFATDLVQISLGSALRDLQKSVSCTSTLCHLAARLTSSVFQMAFHEIGMRYAYLLKERAISGLASLLVGEALSGALKEFLMIKNQIFHSTVKCFAANLAEELVFEGTMEVCQFSHPSTPITPSECFFGHKQSGNDEVVSSYASDLSESVIQEVFIELSQTYFAFPSEAAISVSLDNIYVSTEKTSTGTCSASDSQQSVSAKPAATEEADADGTCTVPKALCIISGMASGIPVPQASQVLSHVSLKHVEPYQQLSFSHNPQSSSESLKESASNTITTTLGRLHSHEIETPVSEIESSQSKSPLQNFSGGMVDLIVNGACDIITSSKMKKSLGDCADFLTKTIGTQRNSNEEVVGREAPNPPRKQENDREGCRYDCRYFGYVKKDDSGSQDDLLTLLDQNSSGTPDIPPNPQKSKDLSKKTQTIPKLTKLSTKIPPATPPPIPSCHPRRGSGEPPVANRAELSYKLLRSVSDQINAKEDEDKRLEEEEVIGINCEEARSSREIGRRPVCRVSKKESLYAEWLACHILSMATEMDGLGMEKGEGNLSFSAEGRASVTHFSERTLNTLWVYAGEVAGEVISDVMQTVSSAQQCPYHRVLKKRCNNRCSAECLYYSCHPSQTSANDYRDRSAGLVADKLSKDITASVLRSPTSASRTLASGSSSPSLEYPSEIVTNKFAGYLIKVLKKEGSSRDLVYHSTKLDLTHADPKLKQKPSPSHFHSSSCNTSSSLKNREAPGNDGPRCSETHREHTDLANFAESLANNITCDATLKLVSSARLPKSLTDSCLYRKSRLADTTDHLIRHSFSCPFIDKESEAKRSVHDGVCKNRAKHAIRHYANKTVDNTLEMSLCSIGRSSHKPQEIHSSDKHTRVLSEMSLHGQTAEQKAHHYCCSPEGPHCPEVKRHSHQPVLHKKKRMPECQARAESLCSLEVPKIHIDQYHKTAFAEEMVAIAMETAKHELSNTSLNVESGIGHDGTSYDNSLTAEITTSTLSKTCHDANISFSRREATEPSVSQQLSVGDDSLGSWSNLSFEDDSSSFLHLSDSTNGNSSSWSSLGLEGEAYEEHISFSPSDSDNTEDKESGVKEESSETLCVDRTCRTTLVIVNSDIRGNGCDPQHASVDPQLRSMLQWVAASLADIPHIQLTRDKDLKQMFVFTQQSSIHLLAVLMVLLWFSLKT
ncbi:A-kinase anchor protein 11 isoform X2 [Takifugu flavidus]|uniref:A-kinase anchor protein 11 isoform X2 n=1 Tax=Takifugu flavidus TaxID=433684 RepID=UPI00254463A2|nr:A-kinase anchor protein 11 isoform X2 [Takifugu flavidus]